MSVQLTKKITASIFLDGDAAKNTIKGLESQTAQFRAELKNLTIGTAEWNAKMKEVSSNNLKLKELRNEINGVGGAFSQLKQELGKVGTLAVGYLGFQFISDQFQGIISGNAKLSDSLADVRRVTGLTEAGVLDLDRSLGKLDTRTSKSGLRDIAVIAGKLGVAKNDILDFVAATDKLTVALGDELGDADAITTQLGKILNVFDGKVTGENITRLGNAMVGLANDGVASGAFIAQYTQLISGIAKTAGVSLPATMALGAGLEELGGRAESSATATQKLLISITQNKDAYKLAGVPLSEFNKMLADAPEKALLLYTKGLVANKNAFADVTQELKDNGEEGARTIELITKLGGSTEMFNAKIEKTAQLYQETGEITSAYNLKNQTLGAQVDKLGKDFNSLASNTTLVDLLTTLVHLTSSSVKWLKEHTAAIAFFAKILITATIAWTAYRIATALATAEKLNWIRTLLTAETIEKLGLIRMTAMGLAQALLTGNIKKAAQEWKALNIIMQTNPWGIALAAITALGTAVYLYNGQLSNAAKIQQNYNEINSETIKAVDEEKNKINALIKVIESKTATDIAKKNAIEEIRKIMPDHLKGYDDEQIKAGKAKNAILEYVSALKQRYYTENSAKKLAEIQAKKEDINNAIKNGYSASSTVGERIAASFNQNKGETTGQAWVRAKKAEIEALAAQEAEVQTNYQKSVEAALTNSNNNNGPASEVRSLDFLKKKLEEVTKARSATTAGSITFNKLTKEQLALQKEIDQYDPKKIAGTNNKAESEAEKNKNKALAEFEKLDDDYKKLNLQRLNDQLSANEKEIKQEADKYDALIVKQKEFLLFKGATPEQKKKTEQNISQLETDKETATTAIRVRQEAEMVKNIEELNINLTQIQETELQKQKNQINKFYDEQEAKFKGNDKAIAQLKIERVKELSSAELREKERLEKEKADLEARYETLKGETPAQRIAKINKKYEDELSALRSKFSKELQLTREFKDAEALILKNKAADLAADELSKRIEKSNEQLNAAHSIANSTFSIMANSRDAETNRYISSLEQRRKAELENDNLTEEQKTEINNRYNEQVKQERIKAWKAEKAAAVAQALINGALAMTKVSAQTGILTFAFSPFVAAATAAQVAVILSQSPPEFAEGGMSNEDPSGYVSKATLFNRSASGRPFVAGEKGKEWIAPNWMLNNPRTANIIGTLEMARKEKRMFASGGFNDVGGGTSNQMMYNFERLESMITSSIAEQRRFNSLPIVNVYADKEEYERKLQRDRAQQTA